MSTYPLHFAPFHSVSRSYYLFYLHSIFVCLSFHCFRPAFSYCLLCFTLFHLAGARFNFAPSSLSLIFIVSPLFSPSFPLLSIVFFLAFSLFTLFYVAGARFNLTSSLFAFIFTVFFFVSHFSLHNHCFLPCFTPVSFINLSPFHSAPPTFDSCFSALFHLASPLHFLLSLPVSHYFTPRFL